MATPSLFEVRLYRIPFSTNVERVALALAYKRLEVESVWIGPADRSLVERVSGQPLVPVLEDGGEVVIDSTSILRRLEEIRPEPPLFPCEPARRAELDVFLDWFDRVWKRAPNEIETELGSPRPDDARIETLGNEMRRSLDRFEALLDGRDYLFGDSFSAADCAAFPFLKYAAGRDERDDELFHRILESRQPLGSDHPWLGAWIERVDTRARA